MNHHHTLRRAPSGEDGATLIIVTLSLLALFGMMVLVVDVGSLLYARRAMVNAADAAALAAAQSCGQKGLTWGFGPTVVPADDFADRFGARVQAGWCAADHLSQDGGSLSYVIGLDGQYLWVRSDVQVPDATQARAAALLSWSIPGGAEARADSAASPDRREHRLAVGGELRYVNTSPTPWAMLIPSVIARWEWVEPTASDAVGAAGVGESDDGHSRGSVRGYLNMRGAFLSTTLEGWSLVVDGSLFRASGLEQVLADAGWDSGEHVAVTLRFARRVGIAGPLALTSVYAGYAGGQLPTDFEGRDALVGGVSLAVGG